MVIGALTLARAALRYGAGRASRKALCAISALIGLAGVAWAEPVTIAALGDSLTQGFGLPVDQGFVPQLQDWLKARGHDVVIINAGVSGDTTAGGLSRAEWTLTPDVDAMIVALGGNDLLRGLPPEASRANLAGILEIAQAKGVEVLLLGLEAPGNYGPDYKAAFEAMYPELAQDFGALHGGSFLQALTALEDRASAIRTYMQPDGIHPNAAGVEKIVESLGPKVEDLIKASTGS